MNQGSFLMYNLEKFGVPEVKLLVNDVSNFYIGFSAGVSRIVA